MFRCFQRFPNFLPNSKIHDFPFFPKFWIPVFAKNSSSGSSSRSMAAASAGGSEAPGREQVRRARCRFVRRRCVRRRLAASSCYSCSRTTLARPCSRRPSPSAWLATPTSASLEAECVFLSSLERTYSAVFDRIPRSSPCSHPSHSRGALNTMHNTVSRPDAGLHTKAQPRAQRSHATRTVENGQADRDRLGVHHVGRRAAASRLRSGQTGWRR